ncbi:hypothetical protein JCM10213v2_004707 [Rhodosporidiobolus nylandii]
MLIPFSSPAKQRTLNGAAAPEVKGTMNEITLSDSDPEDLVVLPSSSAPSLQPLYPERPYRAEAISLPDSEEERDAVEDVLMANAPFTPSPTLEAAPLPASALYQPSLSRQTDTKAARKSVISGTAGVARRAPPKQKRTVRQTRSRRAGPGRKSADLVSAMHASRKKEGEHVRVYDLPYPFNLQLHLDEIRFVPAALPAPSSLGISLGFRSNQQSFQNPSLAGCTRFRLEFRDVNNQGVATISADSGDLNSRSRLSAPICPLPPGTSPSHLLLLVEAGGAERGAEPVYSAVVLLNPDGSKLETAGEKCVVLKPVVQTEGAVQDAVVVDLAWEFDFPPLTVKMEEEDGHRPKNVTDDHGKAVIHDELRKAEQEWRAELMKRDESTCKLESTPLPRHEPLLQPSSPLPSPSSLIPDLDDGTDEDRSAFTHRWAAVPPYFHVEFASRGIPRDDGPLSAFPYVAKKWEDSATAAHDVELSVGDVLQASDHNGKEKSAEDVAEEEERLELYLDHGTLAAPDIGRVERDFHALASLFEQLDLSTSFLTELECEAVNKATASGEYGEDFEAFALQTHGDPDSLAVKALNWFETMTDPYDALAAYNVRTKPKSRPHRARIGGCPQCGRTSCLASEELTTNLSPEAQKTFDELTAQDVPPLDPCTLSLMLEQPVGERIQKGFAPINSSGYEPCECNGPCKGDSCTCSVNETFCDRFCGCPPESTQRAQQAAVFAPKTIASATLPSAVATPRCTNKQVLEHQQKATQLIKSQVKGGGYGLVILEKAEPSDLIGLYRGELFEPNPPADSTRVDGRWKECLFDIDRLLKGTTSSYYFGLNMKETHAVDSEMYGSLMRYINGAATQREMNCHPRIIHVAGTHQIAIFAKRTLKAGDELRFDYGKHFTLDEVRVEETVDA